MKKYKTADGFNIHLLSQHERNQIWSEINRDINPIGKNIPQYTPHDKLEYYIVSQTEVANFKYVTVLSIKGNCYAIRHTDLNQDEKMNKAVRQVYNGTFKGAMYI